MTNDTTSIEAFDPDLEIGGSVMLGGDSDCETCGSSYNEIEWTLVSPTEIELRARIGCYGGEFLATTDLDQAVAFLTGYATSFPEATSALAAEAAQMRTQVTAAHR